MGHGVGSGCSFAGLGAVWGTGTGQVVRLQAWGRYGGLLGPVDPSFRALFERLKFTVRCHKFNKDSVSLDLR